MSEDIAYKNMKSIVANTGPQVYGNPVNSDNWTTVHIGPPVPVPYKYSEGKFMADALAHIDATYSQHYSSGIQTTEFIMANAETLDFLKGNVFKYIQRYGKKDGRNIKDLYKAIHYICMMAHYSKDKQ